MARRCFSSQTGRHLDECGSEKDFRPKKALLVRKVTRYEYEKFYLKPELNEAQLQDYVRNPLSVKPSVTPVPDQPQCTCLQLRTTDAKSNPSHDVDIDGVYERRPRSLCPPHLITLQFNYLLRFFM